MMLRLESCEQLHTVKRCVCAWLAMTSLAPSHHCCAKQGNYAESLRDIEYAARAFREQLREERAASESPAEVSEAGKKATEEALDAVEHPEISRQRNITLNGKLIYYDNPSLPACLTAHHQLPSSTAVAVLQHQRGNYAHALTLYNKVIQSETSMAQLHDRQINHRFLQNRGDTYLATGNLQQVCPSLPDLCNINTHNNISHPLPARPCLTTTALMTRTPKTQLCTVALVWCTIALACSCSTMAPVHRPRLSSQRPSSTTPTCPPFTCTEATHSSTCMYAQ